jgi:hypothetical protein
MNYEITLTPVAEDDLLRLPTPLQHFVVAELERLANAPVSLSRPSAFPYPPNCQLYHFSNPDFDGEYWDFTILFRYGQDERHLQVIGIGHGRRGF